jgi:NADH dehydrogenase FAD-containing subunit
MNTKLGKRRVVIAGLGDTGLLVAVHLSGQFDVVGISTKPCLLSGQDLGARLTQPELWKQDHLMAFGRYRRLDQVRTVHGYITRVDPSQQRVAISLPNGGEQIEPYDILVLSSGVTNGFWRNDAVEDLASIREDIARAAEQIAEAKSVAVIGGGATGVSVAANVRERYPEKEVDFFFSGAQPLPGYHPKVRASIKTQLERTGVRLHPEHRAIVPEGFACDRLTRGPVHWSTGQPSFEADVTLWSVGRVRPNNGFIPQDMLDDRGFVRTDEFLRVPGYPNVFAVGDIAATDPHRCSARNWGYRLVAHNVRASLEGREDAMKRFRPPQYRWGSILGVQKNGMRVFQPNGGSFRFPLWAVRNILFPIVVEELICRGVRKGTSG